MSSAVAVDGLWKFYGDYPALRDIRLEAGEGACLALIGRNGAGDAPTHPGLCVCLRVSNTPHASPAAVNSVAGLVKNPRPPMM